MVLNKQEALQYIRDNNILFICLQFCDIFGELKNISIMPSQLEHAFDYGTEFNASAIKGFLNETESNLLLFPDPTTMSPLPPVSYTHLVQRELLEQEGVAFDEEGRVRMQEFRWLP